MVDDKNKKKSYRIIDVNTSEKMKKFIDTQYQDISEDLLPFLYLVNVGDILKPPLERIIFNEVNSIQDDWVDEEEYDEIQHFYEDYHDIDVSLGLEEDFEEIIKTGDPILFYFMSKHKFINNLWFYTFVNALTGNQYLLFISKNKTTGEIKLVNTISCIHVALADISPLEFENYLWDEHGVEKIYEDSLYLRSSETLEEIKLDPQEKFRAFRSWTAGIAESGVNSFKICQGIEKLAQFIYPISTSSRFVSSIIICPPGSLRKVTSSEMESIFKSTIFGAAAAL